MLIDTLTRTLLGYLPALYARLAHRHAQHAPSAPALADAIAQVEQALIKAQRFHKWTRRERSHDGTHYVYWYGDARETPKQMHLRHQAQRSEHVARYDERRQFLATLHASAERRVAAADTPATQRQAKQDQRDIARDMQRLAQERTDMLAGIDAVHAHERHSLTHPTGDIAPTGRYETRDARRARQSARIAADVQAIAQPADSATDGAAPIGHEHPAVEPAPASRPAFGAAAPKTPPQGKTPKAAHQGDGVQLMLFSQSARGASGQFTRHGSADHYAGHLATYRQAKAAGDIDGTQADFDAHRQQWHGTKRQRQLDLLKDLRHAEAELRGMAEDATGYAALAAKVATLRAQTKAST